jgi:hypothetical protein
VPKPGWDRKDVPQGQSPIFVEHNKTELSSSLFNRVAKEFELIRALESL